MDDKLYIKKFIRDDGEKLSFDGEQLYLAQENTLLVRPDPSTTAVNFTEADGGEMIHQQNTTYDQPVNGLIIPKSTDYWTLTKQLSLFFKVNHTYKIVYIKKDGSMFAVSNAWISSGLQIVPVPHEEYSEWSITMTIGNVNWTEYAEDSQGNEIYSNTITLPLLSSATGGEEWEYEEPDPVAKEGTEITFDDTAAGAGIIDLTLKGDTFQQTYSGKNLFGGLTFVSLNNGSAWDFTNNVLTITPSHIDRNPGITFSLGNSLPAGTYTLNCDNYISSSTQLRESAGSMGGGANFNNGYSNVKRTTTATTSYITFNWAATGSLDPFSIDLSTLQIEAGSTATSYEPYVGGTASPNPDYPQDINVVTGEQTVKVTGKNLFTFGFGTGTYQGITWTRNGDTAVGSGQATANYTDTAGRVDLPTPLKANQEYVFSIPSAVNYSYNLYLFDKDGNVVSPAAKISVGQTSVTFTKNVDIYKARVTLSDFGGVGTQLDLTLQAQVEAGSTPTSWNPCQSQSYTVDLGSIELCKIGTYQDYIYKSGDDWYVHKEIDKVQYTGSETWTYQSEYSRCFTPKPGNIGSTSSNYTTTTKCSHFTPGDTTGLLNNVYYVGGSAISFKSTSVIISLDAWKTWLGSNNLIVYYALATPTDTKITDNTLIGELEALYAAQGYNDKTIITVSATGTNLPAILAVTLQNPPITGEVWDNVGTVWELGSGGPQTINIDSTTTVYPVWVVQGPCINPTLQNNTTDTLAQYDGTVAAGQTLTVDFADGTAHLDSALVTRYINGLVSLRPGDNTLGFNSDGGTTETSTISWNNVIN